MDKPIAKKPVYYRYRWHIAGGIAFIVLLIYVGIAASGGRKLRTDAENLIIGEATSDKFLEYVDVEGVVQPILTIQINTREAGSVDRIIAEEGTMMNKGDTILTLNNPDLIRAIEDQQDEWEKQLISYQEKEIEMEQKSIDLQQKTLQTTYELNRLKKSYALDEEEFNMGVKSKAQLEVARDEFDYKTRSTALQLEGLRHDSAATILRRELMKNDLERERKKFERVRERMEDLVVRAPLSGQLSFVKVTPGQQVQSTEAIAEIKVLDQFKIHTSLSEYYIDRITTGLPATITWQNKKYPLRITKVVPEVKDRKTGWWIVTAADRFSSQLRGNRSGPHSPPAIPLHAQRYFPPYYSKLGRAKQIFLQICLVKFCIAGSAPVPMRGTAPLREERGHHEEICIAAAGVQPCAVPGGLRRQRKLCRFRLCSLQ